MTKKQNAALIYGESMETILVWTLVIAAIAIVSMLVLLIASEREVNRTRREAESLRATLESANAVPERPNLLVDESTGISAEMPRLIEQVRANEIAIATMQCELEALRAENSWLKQESAPYQSKSAAPEALVPESIVTPQLEPPDPRAADFRLDLSPRRNRLIFPAAAAALLLIALVSVFFARGRTIFPAARQAESGADLQNLATASAITSAAESSDLMIHPELAPKMLVPKQRAGGFAGSSYEVVRSTRVFSEPNESSRPLARIEAGMEINVVGARDEWLEVRSRHGRPPGFIRKDAVIQKSQK
jgi:hypothetical protein